MSSCDELARASETALACPIASDLQDEASGASLALFAASELSPSSHTDVTSGATTALKLERYASELLQWLERSDATCRVDQALYFFETRHPELLDDLPLLFTWLSLFLAQHGESTSLKPMHALEPATTLGHDVALKSALTLLYWKHEDERQERGPSGKTRTVVCFPDHKGLLAWLAQHRHVPLTRQDILHHVVDAYPVFAASKSAAALKVWTSRFLKKHVPSFHEATTTEAPGLVDATASRLLTTEASTESTPSKAGIEPPRDKNRVDIQSDPTLVQRTGKRRSCSGRYMLFSNEFKLHAIEMLEAGKSVAQVAAELGLKNPNCLSYWKSIRDKLVTAERKRFRLAGGGRRSCCTFEDELLTWVSERHHRGQGTDVKAVLDYLKQSHASFTEGKKEPTLRKWILRFFKRCWGVPCPPIDDAQDAAKTYIFV